MANRIRTEGKTLICKTPLRKTKDLFTRISLKTGGELKRSEMLSISCSTSGTRRVTLVTNPGKSNE